MPPAIGDYLVSKKVHICSVYGGTEFGCVTTLKLTEDRNDWQWHRFSEEVEINWLPQGDGTFECQFLVNLALDTSETKLTKP